MNESSNRKLFREAELTEGSESDSSEGQEEEDAVEESVKSKKSSNMWEEKR